MRAEWQPANERTRLGWWPAAFPEQMESLFQSQQTIRRLYFLTVIAGWVGFMCIWHATAGLLIVGFYEWVIPPPVWILVGATMISQSSGVACMRDRLLTAHRQVESAVEIVTLLFALRMILFAMYKYHGSSPPASSDVYMMTQYLTFTLLFGAWASCKPTMLLLSWLPNVFCVLASPHIDWASFSNICSGAFVTLILAYGMIMQVRQSFLDQVQQNASLGGKLRELCEASAHSCEGPQVHTSEAKGVGTGNGHCNDWTVDLQQCIQPSDMSTLPAVKLPSDELPDQQLTFEGDSVFFQLPVGGEAIAYTDKNSTPVTNSDPSCSASSGASMDAAVAAAQKQLMPNAALHAMPNPSHPFLSQLPTVDDDACQDSKTPKRKRHSHSSLSPSMAQQEVPEYMQPLAPSNETRETSALLDFLVQREAAFTMCTTLASDDMHPILMNVTHDALCLLRITDNKRTLRVGNTRFQELILVIGHGDHKAGYEQLIQLLDKDLEAASMSKECLVDMGTGQMLQLECSSIKTRCGTQVVVAINTKPAAPVQHQVAVPTQRLCPSCSKALKPDMDLSWKSFTPKTNKFVKMEGVS